jgi:hypothetical protein
LPPIPSTGWRSGEKNPVKLKAVVAASVLLGTQNRRNGIRFNAVCENDPFQKILILDGMVGFG